LDKKVIFEENLNKLRIVLMVFLIFSILINFVGKYVEFDNVEYLLSILTAIILYFLSLTYLVSNIIARFYFKIHSWGYFAFYSTLGLGLCFLQVWTLTCLLLK
jgi:hypothetical protein